MADIRAIASGNWSAGGTWNGGVPPGASDNAFANNFTVTVDQDVTCLSLNTTAGGGGVAGGGYTVATTRTINANILAGSTVCVTLSGSGVTLTVNGNVTGGASHGINQTGNSSVLNVTGNVTAPGAGHGIQLITGSGMSATVTGNVTGGSGSISSVHGINMAVASTVTVNGAVTGGGAGGGVTCYGVYGSVNLCSITVHGNISGGNTNTSYGVSSTGGTITVDGGRTLTAGTVGGSSAINTATSPVTTVIGTVDSPCTLMGSASGTGAAVLSLTAPNSTSTVYASGDTRASNSYLISTGGTNSNFTLTGSIHITGLGGILNNSATGTVTFNGNYAGTSNVGATSALFQHGSTGGTLIINGNVSAGAAATGINVAGNGAILIVTGNLDCNSAAVSSVYALSISATSVVTVNGDVAGSSSLTLTGCYGINVNGSNLNVTVNGRVTAGANCYGVYLPSSGTYYFKTLRANDYPNNSTTAPYPAVWVTSNTYQVGFKNLEFGSGGACPLSSGGKFYIVDDGTNYVQARQSNAGTISTLGANVTSYPNAADVRDGTSYNSGSQVGTLKVPLPSQVEVGVHTDNTVGTAALTPADVWDFLQASAVTADSMGVRLKNCATVETTGNQVAALNP